MSCSNNSLDKKVVGTWNKDTTDDMKSTPETEGAAEAQMTAILKCAADKTFLYTIEVSVGEGEAKYHNKYILTGVWHVDDQQLIWTKILGSDPKEKQPSEVKFDIVQIGENSMALKKDGKTMIFTKAQ